MSEKDRLVLKAVVDALDLARRDYMRTRSVIEKLEETLRHNWPNEICADCGMPARSHHKTSLPSIGISNTFRVQSLQSDTEAPKGTQG